MRVGGREVLASFRAMFDDSFSPDFGDVAWEIGGDELSGNGAQFEPAESSVGNVSISI